MDEQLQGHLPYAEQAMVEERKLVDYLLNLSHPEGRGKAMFFELLGFNRARPYELRVALYELAQAVDVLEESSPYGRKFVGI